MDPRFFDGITAIFKLVGWYSCDFWGTCVAWLDGLEFMGMWLVWVDWLLDGLLSWLAFKKDVLLV